MGLEFLRRGAFGNGRSPGNRVIERAAEAVNIAANIGAARVHRLFGRDVIEGAERHAGLRQAAIYRVRFEVPCEAHIDDLRPPARRDDDIRRFNVAVNDTSFGGVPQPGGDLQHVPHAIGSRHGAEFVDHLPQVFAFDILERDEMQVAIFATKVNPRDIVVIELRRRTSFLFEARHRFRIAGRFRWQNLQRNDAAEFEVAGFEHGGHTARADGFDQLEVPELLSRYARFRSSIDFVLRNDRWEVVAIIGRVRKDVGDGQAHEGATEQLDEARPVWRGHRWAIIARRAVGVAAQAMIAVEGFRRRPFAIARARLWLGIRWRVHSVRTRRIKRWPHSEGFAISLPFFNYKMGSPQRI